MAFHFTRHTFATLMLTLDVDLYTTSKLLGHKNIVTTQIYAKIIECRQPRGRNFQVKTTKTGNPDIYAEVVCCFSVIKLFLFVSAINRIWRIGLE